MVAERKVESYVFSPFGEVYMQRKKDHEWESEEQRKEKIHWGKILETAIFLGLKAQV